jgi:hypothetical protein
MIETGKGARRQEGPAHSADPSIALHGVGTTDVIMAAGALRVAGGSVADRDGTLHSPGVLRIRVARTIFAAPRKWSSARLNWLVSVRRISAPNAKADVSLA